MFHQMERKCESIIKYGKAAIFETIKIIWNYCFVTEANPLPVL